MPTLLDIEAAIKQLPQSEARQLAVTIITRFGLALMMNMTLF